MGKLRRHIEKGGKCVFRGQKGRADGVEKDMVAGQKGG